MADNVSALSNEIDVDKINVVMERVGRLGTEVDSMVDMIVKEASFELDLYMADIDKILTSQSTPVTDIQLDDFVLNLPSILYSTSSALEKLGIKEDVSKAVQKEVFNRVREKAQGTIADKDTAAELQTQSEYIVFVVHNRAYRKVKLRIEAGWEMLNSVKKVISRRIAEYELTISDRGR